MERRLKCSAKILPGSNQKRAFIKSDISKVIMMLGYLFDTSKKSMLWYHPT